MSERGSYFKYYDKFGKQIIPSSTMHAHQKNKNISSGSNAVNLESKTVSEDLHNATTRVVNEAVDITITDRPQPSTLLRISNSSKNPSMRAEDKLQDSLRMVLCNCTNLNVAEVLLMTVELAKKHSLTWIALLDIFEMLNYIFDKKIFPITKYKLNKFLQINTDSLKYHILCSKCHKYLGESINLKENIVCTCGLKVESSSVGSFFIEIDVKSQLKKLFSDKKIVNNLDHKFVREKLNCNALEDIYDGRVYEEFTENNDLLDRNKHHFSYTFNTDGCQSSDNSKVSVWPIYLMLHELPNHLRNKYMILAGLWVAKSEPEMNMFLEPFVNQANELSLKGFDWSFNNKIINSKLFPLGCCVDSVARCAMLNMKKFNGKKGCTYCDHPTEAVNGIRKYTMQSTVPINRTDESIKHNMIVAQNNINDVEGVWGPSALMNLHHFNLVRGMIVDFMHACLLGVTELYMTILFTDAKKKYYIGSPAKIDIIDQRLLQIKPPTCIGKVPRSLKERNMWKASEWLMWLIFYSLICLRGILSRKYYNNLALFVEAMQILLQDSIKPEMLRTAKILLIKFVFNFENLYGKKYMHYNMHLLLHLCDNVQSWGPLWADSTFPFENQNKQLLKMKKCNHRIAQQIAVRLLIYQQLPILYNNSDLITSKTREFCDNLHENRLKNVTKFNDCVFLGSGKSYNFSEEEIACLQNVINVIQINECTKYCKIIYNNCRYTTNTYSRCKKNKDCFIQTKDNKFCVINKICHITYNNNCSDVIIFYKILETDNVSLVNTDDVQITHFIRCNSLLNKLHAMRYSNMYRPCIFMTSKKEYFICTIPKGVMGRNLN